MNKLSDTQLAYLAGFIDGEGCIYIGKCFRKNTPNPVYTLKLIISQANYEFISTLHKTIGAGAVFTSRSLTKSFKNESYNANQKRMYDLVVSSMDAKDLLEIILDYLIIKKKQAELAIQFQNSMDRRYSGSRPGQQGGNKTPPEIIEFRERCRLALMQLKDGIDTDTIFEVGCSAQLGLFS